MKTLIVYAHLLSACLAIGVLLLQDIALAKTQGKPLSSFAIEELFKTAKITFIALALLWVSGVLLVLIGYLDNPEKYLLNQKLWAKFSVVMILTINGIFLHYYAFPKVVSPLGVTGLKTSEQFLVLLSGSISSVSWLFACYLGIARPWNNTVDYSFVMYIYLFLIVVAFIIGSEILNGVKRLKLPSILNLH